MGVEPYLVASSLEVVIAQRLVRLICKECKTEMPEAEVRPLRVEFGDLVPDVLYHGTGCRNCQGTGDRGRQGVFEIMGIRDESRSLLLHRAAAHESGNVAVTRGQR